MTSDSAATDWKRLLRVPWQRALLPTVITLAFLAALFLNPAFNLSRLAQSFAEANYLWLAPGVGAFLGAVWIRAVRWRWLLRPIADIPTSRLYPALVIGFMANNLLPVRAGELVRANELATREGVSRSTAIATILVERVFDGLTLLGMLALVSLIAPLPDWIAVVLRGGGLGFVGVLGALMFLALGGRFAEQAVARAVTLLPARFQSKAAELAATFFIGLTSLRRPSSFLSVLAASIAVWYVESFAYLFVLVAFSISGPAYLPSLVTSVANLAITVPSSQGGIGPFEFFAAETVKLFGASASVAAAFAIVAHATVLLPVMPLGAWFLWRGRARRSHTSL